MDLSPIIKFVIIAGSMLIASAATFIFKFKANNPVEEIAEEIIYKETGVDIDLTPFDPE